MNPFPWNWEVVVPNAYGMFYVRNDAKIPVSILCASLEHAERVLNALMMEDPSDPGPARHHYSS